MIVYTCICLSTFILIELFESSSNSLAWTKEEEHSISEPGNRYMKVPVEIHKVGTNRSNKVRRIYGRINAKATNISRMQGIVRLVWRNMV